eukprot:5882871-Pyramimonas_sp.AAC.1
MLQRVAHHRAVEWMLEKPCDFLFFNYNSQRVVLSDQKAERIIVWRYGAESYMMCNPKVHAVLLKHMGAQPIYGPEAEHHRLDSYPW